MFSPKPGQRIYYGWWIVISCSLLNLYGAGTFFYGFTVFVHPMVTDLGWSMALVSGAFALFRLESGLGASLAGFLLDRIGPRFLVCAGGLMWGAGFVYLSYAATVFHFYMAFVIISLGYAFASGTAVPAALIGKWFVRKRGRALGIFTAISGFSGLLVPVLSHIVVLYGWQSTLLMIGVCTFLVTVPLSLTLSNNPEDHGLLPDGLQAPSSSEAHLPTDVPASRDIDLSVDKALLTPAFWLLCLAATSFQLTMSALFVHLVPHLITVGIEARVASLAVTFITLFSVLGRAGFGWLSDLYSNKWLLIIAFLLKSVGLFVFSQVHRVINLIPFLLTYSPSYGAVIVLRPAITGEYFGRKNFGTIFGIILGVGMFGGIVGPVMAGLAYDHYRSFRQIFVLFALISLLTSLVLLLLKPPKDAPPGPVSFNTVSI